MTTQLNITTEALVVESKNDVFKMTPIVLTDLYDDEVVVQMKYSGICHTDLILQHGLLPPVDFPAIFGHEGAGTVLQVGAVAAQKDPALRPGATVLLSFNTCGTCRECTASRPSRCLVHVQANASCVRLRDGSTPARMVTGSSQSEIRVRSQCFGQSSFSRVSVVSARSVVVVPEALLSTTGRQDGIDPLAVYAPLGCGFQTGAGTIFNVLKAGPDDSIVIFGMGSVGLAALMAARHSHVRQLLAVDVVEEKLAMARELGATDTLNAKGVADADVVAEVRRLSGGGGVTYAIDCTGLVSVIESLVECLAAGGTAVSVGVPAPGKKIQIDALSFLMDSKTFVGVIEGDSQPQKLIPELIKIHRQGNFPIDKLCSVYSVRDFEQAVSDMKTGKVIKPIIRWD